MLSCRQAWEIRWVRRAPNVGTPRAYPPQNFERSYVRFTLIATELMRRNETTRSAGSRHTVQVMLEMD